MLRLNIAETPVLRPGTGFYNTTGSDILGGISDMLQDAYRKKQVELENKRRADELAMEGQRLEADERYRAWQKNRQDAADFEEHARMTNEPPPDMQTVEKHPAEMLDMSMPADPELGIPGQKVEMPSFTQVEKRTPITEKVFGAGEEAVTGHADWGGKQAAALKQQMDIAEGRLVKSRPEAIALLKQYGLEGYVDPTTGVIPASVLQMAVQARREDALADRSAAAEAARDRRAAAHDAAMLARSDMKAKTPTETADEVFPELDGQDLLEAIRKTQPATAKMLEGITAGTTDVTKSSSIRGNRREYLVALASRIDPSYDMTQQPARAAMRRDYTAGTTAQNIKSINTAISHLGTLKSAVDEAGLSGVPIYNTVKNWLKKTAGSGDIKALETAIEATATEMAAALKGGRAAPTSEEIKEQRRILTEAGSPEQWNAVIRKRAELLAARLNSQREAWAAQFGSNPEQPFIRPEARATLRRLGLEDILEETQSTGSAPPPPPTSGTRDSLGVRYHVRHF